MVAENLRFECELFWIFSPFNHIKFSIKLPALISFRLIMQFCKSILLRFFVLFLFLRVNFRFEGKFWVLSLCYFFQLCLFKVAKLVLFPLLNNCVYSRPAFLPRLTMAVVDLRRKRVLFAVDFPLLLKSIVELVLGVHHKVIAVLVQS